MSIVTCPTEGTPMTVYQRSAVAVRVCGSCGTTVLPPGGLEQILATERTPAPPPQVVMNDGYGYRSKHGGFLQGLFGGYGRRGHH